MRKKLNHRKIIRRFSSYAALSAGAFIFLIPFFWLLTTSMKTNEEYNAIPPRWLPPLPYKAQQSPYVAVKEYDDIPVPENMDPKDWFALKSRVIDRSWEKIQSLNYPALVTIQSDPVQWKRLEEDLKRELLNGIVGRIIREGQDRIYHKSPFEIIEDLCADAPLTREDVAHSWDLLLGFYEHPENQAALLESIHELDIDAKQEELFLAAWNVGAEIMGDYRWEEGLRAKIEHAETWNQLIRLYGKKLWTEVILPKGEYRDTRSDDELIAVILKGIHYDRIEKILVNVYRNLVVNGVTLQSKDGIDYPILHPNGQPVLDWKSTGDDSLKKFFIDAKPCVELAYDFSSEESKSFNLQIPLPIPMEQIERIILPIRGDFSFHEIDVTIETANQVYRSKTPFHIHHHIWIGAIWQREIHESAKKGGLTLRGQEYIEFMPDPTVQSSISESGLAKLTLTVKKVPTLTAVWRKFSLNYVNTFRFVQFGKFFLNSTILTILNIGGQLLVCPLIAFGFSRIKWPGRDIVFGLVLATMMLPHQVTMIPQFLIFRHLGMYDTLFPLWLPSLFGTGFYIFLMRQFFMTIPLDYEEAAKLDGCGFIRTYFKISLPLIRPAMAAIVIFQFMATWNDFLRPLIFLNSEDKIPLPLGLFMFKSGWWSQEYGILMAASIIMLMPVLIVFFMAQKHFIESISLTGAKG